jgi:putative ribosome biogenesis GTPase RsgA
VVIAAVESGAIDEERYHSYLRLREELGAEDERQGRRR